MPSDKTRSKKKMPVQELDIEDRPIEDVTQPVASEASVGGKGGKGVKRDVDYTLEFMDDLPGTPMVRGGGGGKPSVFEERIAALKEDVSKHGKWARLASYQNASAASAAANVLRHRHGLPYVKGLVIETRRVEGEAGVSRTLLFVKFDPSLVEDGGEAKWAAAEADRAAKNQARKAAKSGAVS